MHDELLNASAPAGRARSVQAILALPAILLLLGLQCAKEGEKPRRDILNTETSRYSQTHEEVIIRDFFQDMEEGVFVDVGCAHARKHSTTYYLEKHLNWSGIGVDAVEAYRKGYDQYRPRTKFCCYIVTDHGGTVEPFYKLDQYYLMSTHSKEYADKVSKGDYEIINVPTITLTDLLDQNGITRVDLLSMDIEGSEPAALAGFDIERFRPALVCIEAHPPIREQLLEYFTGHGYELIEHYSAYNNQLNWYFKPKDS